MQNDPRRGDPRNRFDAITYKLEEEAKEAGRFAQHLPEQRKLMTTYRMHIQNIATLAQQELDLIDAEILLPPIIKDKTTAGNT